jgi:hypothetical protein
VLTNAVLWSNGYDTCFTRRKRWFDSIQDYLHTQVRQSAERLGLNPSVCRFDPCSGYLQKYVLAEQRSARLPVTQETVGSNPIGDAQKYGTVRQSGRATDFKRPWMWVRLPPVLLEQHASVGHWQAPLAVTQTSVWTLAVRLRPGALGCWSPGFSLSSDDAA